MGTISIIVYAFPLLGAYFPTAYIHVQALNIQIEELIKSEAFKF